MLGLSFFGGDWNLSEFIRGVEEVREIGGYRISAPMAL